MCVDETLTRILVLPSPPPPSFSQELIPPQYASSVDDSSDDDEDKPDIGIEIGEWAYNLPPVEEGEPDMSDLWVVEDTAMAADSRGRKYTLKRLGGR